MEYIRTNQRGQINYTNNKNICKYVRILNKRRKNIWKEQIEKARFLDFTELKNWLKDKKVNFKEFNNGIDLDKFFVSDLLKVYFEGTKKGYQYNLDGIKERIVKDFGLSL